MKALIGTIATFGPFEKIETLADRYICDGVVYQFDVIGQATVGDWVPPPATIRPPEVVSMRQARRALRAAGLLGTVDAAIAALPGTEGDDARIDWEFATEVRRDSPLIAQLAPALGLSDAQLDGLFVAAGLYRE